MSRKRGIPPVNTQHLEQSPIFLYGVGAQKAGTTWLFRQLANHLDVGFGWKKEIMLWGKVWDKKLADRPPKRVINKVKQHLYTFPNGRTVPLFSVFAKQLARQYFEEFRRVSAGKTVVAGVTPHYSAMTHGGFGFIRREAHNYGFRPKALFTMRDSVKRVISGVMHSNRSLKSPTNETLVELVKANYASYPVSVRTRYDSTIKNLEQVFDPSEIMYMFSEDLFNEQSMNQLASWLKISPIAADFDQKVGPGTHRVVLPDGLVHEIREHYDPVYTFCREKFGATTINRMWNA
jgi:hypothetical protein